MPNRVSFGNRLGVRLAAVLVLLVLAAMALMVTLLLRFQRSRLVGQVVEDADVLSETIRRSTYHAMLEDRRADVYRVMDTIGGQDRIERVRIFNKEGRITFSTDTPEADSFVDTRAESCYACHAAGRPIVRLNLPSRSRIYVHGGHRVLGMVTPIYNEPGCANAACHVHPASQRVLGVVDIGISLESIDRGARTLERTTVALGALTVLLIAAVVIVFTRRYVVRPVASLVARTRRIAAGDLTADLPVEDSSELGVLEHSFNDMATSLGRMRAERLELLNSLERKVEERTAELARAQQRLVQSEKLSSLGRLAASIAHEINNPLAGILTYAKLLIRQLADAPPSEAAQRAAVRHLRLVQRETERCSAIVRNLLEFARERALTVGDADVNAILEEALSLVANQARLQGIVLEKHLDAVAPVRADAGQLRQAFINVIINACDAMPQGGTLRVETCSEAENDRVAIGIADTGCGIPPDLLTKVLEPFFTTKEKGTGLGLSVVYGIVERHGGRLTIDSTQGRGTTVRIVLPVTDSASGDPTAGQPLAAARDTA